MPSDNTIRTFLAIEIPKEILDQFERIFTTPIDRVSRRRGPARSLGLDRIPDATRSIGCRLKRKWRQWTSNV